MKKTAFLLLILFKLFDMTVCAAPVPITNGGTSATSQSSNGVTYFDGSKITSNGSFSYDAMTNTVSANITGTASTVTDGVYTTGSYANPSWITSLSGSKLTGTIATGDLAGSSYQTPAVANSAITNAKIANSTIDLTTKVTGVLPNANTTATSSNVNSAIVARDSAGNTTVNISAANTFYNPSADADKWWLLGGSTRAKITHAGGWDFQFISGESGNASTGQFGWFTANSAGTWTRRMTLTNPGDLSLLTAGATVSIKTGTNACAGSGATMVSGAVTVSTTCAITGRIVLLMKTTNGGTTTTGMPRVSISSGTSFTLTGDATDTSTWSWFILGTS